MSPRRTKSPSRSKSAKAKSPRKPRMSGRPKKGSEEAKRRMAWVRSFRKNKGGKKPTKKVKPTTPRRTSRK